MYIFISHSSKDAETALKVCSLLENAGHQCFIAPRDIRSGHEYAAELMLGIERSDALLILLSNHSNTSPHVLREVEHAASQSIPILVYKMEEVALTKSMEYFLMTHQWVNQKVDTDIHVILDCVEALRSGGELLSLESKPESDPKPNLNKQHRNMKSIAIGIAIAAATILMAAIGMSVGWVSEQELEESRQQEEPVFRKKELALGDTVTFGTYNDEPVLWRVIHLSQDNSKAVLITENIITMKAFDAADSGTFNKDNGEDYWKYSGEDFADKALEARVRGSNEWNASNIRAWLNSDTQVVSYEGGHPVKAAMSDMKNGYEDEAGFLYYFTPEEREALVETQVNTAGTVTEDKVFLLNLEELEWLKEADVSILTKPTQAAVSQDATKWYSGYSLDYGVENYFWWLREPKEDRASQCYMVSNGLTSDLTTTQTVGTEGFGIRPAITVDTGKFLILVSE